MAATPYPSIRVAVEGCCHGELNKIFDSLLHKTVNRGQPLPELLIICGDFQTIRNKEDLKCISIPPKYQKIGDFIDYYTGKREAPLLTIFVGGNHEASNYLDELKHGGWVAPKIYYMGHSGVVWYKGLRISGISGIWNPSDFNQPRNEVVPYRDSRMVRSAYHVRKADYIKQSLIRQHLSITISHDWPQDIAHSGNINWLLNKKPFFKKDIETGKLGSPVNKALLERQKPWYWLSAHLHVKFTAIVKHDLKKRKTSASGEAVADLTKKHKPSNENEIAIALSSDDESESETVPQPLNTNGSEIALPFLSSSSDTDEELLPQYDVSDNENGIPSKETETHADLPPIPQSQEFEHPPARDETQFLALDKCLPNRNFLEVIHVPVTSTTHPSFGTENLFHDEEYLAISRVFQNSFSKTEYYNRLHKFEEIFNLNPEIQSQLESEIDLELQKLQSFKPEDFRIDPDSFVMTAPANASKLELYENPQTFKLAEKFGL